MAEHGGSEGAQTTQAFKGTGWRQRDRTEQKTSWSSHTSPTAGRARVNLQGFTPFMLPIQPKSPPNLAAFV